jgi:uncharacterized protein YjdB
MRNLLRPRRALAALLLSGALLPACGKKPAEVRVTPLKLHVFGTDRRAQVKAEVLDKKGNLLPDLNATWASSNPKVATVEASGIVKSVGPGKAQITAKLGELTGTATIEVADVASMVVDPGRATLVGPMGTTMALAADIRDSRGQPVEVKPKWATSDPKVVRVTESGLVASVGEGKAMVTASLGADLSAGSEIRVLFREIGAFEIAPLTLLMKIGETQRINATVRDAAGGFIQDPALAWNSSDPKVASVAGGLVKAESVGTAVISVAAGSKALKATVLVN